MARPLRIVNYAVNGVGMGHVTRLAAVSRWLRRDAASLNLPVEIYFLTSSEAGSLLFAEKFPSFKLPSKTIIEETGLDDATFLPVARAWVLHTLELLRPDLIVVDTFPRGYFDELAPPLAACPRRAFIYRALKSDHARHPAFQEALTHYDAILIPDYAENADSPVPEMARGKAHHVGPIISRERDEILVRDEARRLLGIAENHLAVYISAGGGGDAGAENHIHTTYEALRDRDGLHLIIGAGPLYRGRCIYGERVTWLAQGVSVELMSAFDAAVSAAGYNSFNELMHMGVPTIFLPQAKWADDQQSRAGRAAHAGAAVVLDAHTDARTLSQVVERWRDPHTRASVSTAALNLVPHNHARDAAQVLLGLLLEDLTADPAATRSLSVAGKSEAHDHHRRCVISEYDAAADEGASGQG